MRVAIHRGAFHFKMPIAFSSNAPLNSLAASSLTWTIAFGESELKVSFCVSGRDVHLSRQNMLTSLLRSCETRELKLDISESGSGAWGTITLDTAANVYLSEDECLAAINWKTSDPAVVASMWNDVISAHDMIRDRVGSELVLLHEQHATALADDSPDGRRIGRINHQIDVWSAALAPHDA